MPDFKYRKGYKYQLAERFEILTNVFPEREIVTEFFTLRADGLLILESGYAWDGPSGPAIDTDSFMVASAVHDAGYQMIRQGYFDESYRVAWDLEMKRICGLYNMWKPRRWWTFYGVRHFARRAALPKNRRKTIIIRQLCPS